MAISDHLIFTLYGKHKARALDPDRYHDIVDLWSMRAVDIRGMGSSLTKLDVHVTNRLGQPVKIVVARGTAFAAAGNHQNMVVVQEHVFHLPPHSSKYFSVRVACLNAHRDIPNSRDGFRGVSKADTRVVGYIDAARNKSDMVLQAGVWAITDGLDRRALKHRLIDVESLRGKGSIIDDHVVNEAAAILRRLQIPTSISSD